MFNGFVEVRCCKSMGRRWRSSANLSGGTVGIGLSGGAGGIFFICTSVTGSTNACALTSFSALQWPPMASMVEDHYFAYSLDTYSTYDQPHDI